MIEGIILYFDILKNSSPNLSILRSDNRFSGSDIQIDFDNFIMNFSLVNLRSWDDSTMHKLTVVCGALFALVLYLIAVSGMEKKIE